MASFSGCVSASKQAVPAVLLSLIFIFIWNERFAQAQIGTVMRLVSSSPAGREGAVGHLTDAFHQTTVTACSLSCCTPFFAHPSLSPIRCQTLCGSVAAIVLIANQFVCAHALGGSSSGDGSEDGAWSPTRDTPWYETLAGQMPLPFAPITPFV